MYNFSFFSKIYLVGNSIISKIVTSGILKLNGYKMPVDNNGAGTYGDMVTFFYKIS